MKVSAVITYREIFGREIDETMIKADAAALSLQDCLQSLGKLSHLLAAREEAAASNLILGGLRYPGAVMLATAMVRIGRPLVFGKRLIAAARVAILAAEERDPDGFDQQRDLYRFVRLILGVADVFDPAGTPENATEEEQKDWVASLLLKRVGLPQRSFYSSVIRSVRVFVDLPQRRPELLHVRSPNIAFEREVGLTLERYLAICFAIVVRFAGWNREADSWLLDASYWRDSQIDPAEFDLAARTFSAPVAVIRKEIQKDIDSGHDSIDDIWPFIIHPLIEIEDGVYLTLDVETLGDALTGDGLYWRMKYNPGASANERGNLGEALGHLVEAHCFEVVEPCYSAVASDIGRLFPEVGYRKLVDGEKSRQDGPDLAIFEGAAAAFIEVGIDRANMLETIIRGDLVSFDRDVDEILLHRAEQLDRKITDFITNELTYHDVVPEAVKRFHPVICLIDGFPLGGPLYERIARRIADAGYLQQSLVEPVSIISVEEFEHLCALVEKGKKLTAVLAAHARSRMSHESVRDYLIEVMKVSPEPPALLKKEFEAIGDRFAMQLFGKTLKRS